MFYCQVSKFKRILCGTDNALILFPFMCHDPVERFLTPFALFVINP